MFAELAESAEFEAQVTIEWWLGQRARRRQEQVAAARKTWLLRNPHLATAHLNHHRWRDKQRKQKRLTRNKQRAGSKGGLATAMNRMSAAKAEIRRRMEARAEQQRAA